MMRSPEKPADPVEWMARLAAFANRRILVVGDAMLDEYLWGTVRRICPEAPVPIVESRDRSAPPGGAANSAANIAALGATAWLHGVTGTDYSGECFSSSVRLLDLVYFKPFFFRLARAGHRLSNDRLLSGLDKRPRRTFARSPGLSLGLPS